METNTNCEKESKNKEIYRYFPEVNDDNNSQCSHCKRFDNYYNQDPCIECDRVFCMSCPRRYCDNCGCMVCYYCKMDSSEHGDFCMSCIDEFDSKK